MRFFRLPKPIDVQTEEDFLNFITYVQTTCPKGWLGRLALDTETAKGLSITDNYVVVWSVSDGKERWQLWPEFTWREEFISLWTDPERVWVFQNAKFDMHQMWLMGVPEIAGSPVDTMSMAFLHDENVPSLGMEELAAKYLGVKMKKFKEVFGKPMKGLSSEEVMLNAEPGVLLEYSTEDAYVTWHISDRLKPILEDIPFSDRYANPHFSNAFEYLQYVESPFTKTLWRMERRGIKINPPKVDILELKLEKDLKALKSNMIQEVGMPDFNFNSPKQLKHYFFEVLKLKPKGRPTNTGQNSLDKNVLPLYANEGVALAKMLIEYRGLSKSLSTYVRGYFKDKRTPYWRIHCNFKQHGTVTGRLSSDNPNLQNIPKLFEFREIFEADPGCSLGCFDYGQLELRILGHFSKDDNLNYAFNTGLDLHAHTAALMLGVDYKHVKAAKIYTDAKIPDAEKFELMRDILEAEFDVILNSWLVNGKIPEELIDARSAAKTINFGILYGMSPFKLSKTLDISKDKAKEYMEGWFSSYPKASDFIERQVLEAEGSEYHTVRSIQGRYRRLPCIVTRNKKKKNREERLAVNSTVQGSGGDIAKMAMIQIDNDPELGGGSLNGGTYKVELLLQVHDEIVFQCPIEFSNIVGAKIQEIMSNPPMIDISVPLTVDGGFAPNWGLAK